MTAGLEDTFETVSQSIVAFISRGSFRREGDQAPVLPPVFGTGFIVDSGGVVATNRHVIEAFSHVPNHPETGASGVAAVLFVPDRRNGNEGLRLLMVDVIDAASLTSFTSTGTWFGNEVPDVGFVRLKVRDIPALSLATEDGYIRPGMTIATAGFPLGERPMVMLGNRITQLMPLLRRGIVSSVFPFTGAKQPHGFTIDILQQGGSSGSPIFRCDEPTVVGMMSSGLLDSRVAQGDGLQLTVSLPTNISIAEASAHIHRMLGEFLTKRPPMSPETPTLADLLAIEPELAPKWAAWKAL